MPKLEAHARGNFDTLGNGGGKSKTVRLAVPIGNLMVRGQLWVMVFSRSASCTISAAVKSSPIADVSTYLTYASNLAESAPNTNTGLIRFDLNVDSNGLPGDFLEIVLTVTGDGAYAIIDAMTFLEYSSV